MLESASIIERDHLHLATKMHDAAPQQHHEDDDAGTEDDAVASSSSPDGDAVGVEDGGALGERHHLRLQMR